ncbi:hypothetical protein QE152_g19141 [Popillia japonica]|uniref:Uncharacterized protein n=1 Tax=Popillia japonica TaxID=7064 RepID=A0AAW1L327_POPJA
MKRRQKVEKVRKKKELKELNKTLIPKKVKPDCLPPPPKLSISNNINSQPLHSRAGSQEDESLSKNVESKRSLLNNNLSNLINF